MTKTKSYEDPEYAVLQAKKTGRNSKTISAIAWARARDGTAWQLVLAFTDRDGRAHRVLVRRCEIAQGASLFELLDDHGYPVPADPRARAELRRSIVSADPEPRFRIEDRGKLVPDQGDKAVQAAMAKIIDRLPRLAKRALDATKRRRPIDAKTAAAASVLRVRHSDGRRALALRPDTFKEMIGAAASEKAVAAALDKQGVLIPRGNGRRTWELRFGGVRRSYYCLRLLGMPESKNRRHRTE